MQAFRALAGPLKEAVLGGSKSCGLNPWSSSYRCSKQLASAVSRSYPTEPRVGVGIVVFRRPSLDNTAPEVLLIRRAKEPSKGLWCFPGGSQELGETLAECAAREVEEETGIRIQVEADPGSEGFSSSLAHPTAFAAVDSLVKDADGGVRFHYAIVEVAALVNSQSKDQVPEGRDDAEEACWVHTDSLRALPDLAPMCARIAEEAMQRFPCVMQPETSVVNVA